MRIPFLFVFILLFSVHIQYAIGSQANSGINLNYSYSKPTEKLLKLIRKYPQRSEFKIYGVVACIRGEQVLYTNGICPED